MSELKRKGQTLTLEQVLVFSIGITMIISLLILVSNIYQQLGREADIVMGNTTLMYIYVAASQLDTESLQNHIKIPLPTTSTFRDYQLVGMGRSGIGIELPTYSISLHLSLHGIKGFYGAVNSDDEYAVISIGKGSEYVRISPP